jgi:DNA-binding IscR family transcriptional regulator
MNFGWSRAARDAVAAVVDIGCRAAERPVKCADVSARLGLGPRGLEATLQALVGAGILGSTRGRYGGYAVLDRQATIDRVVRAALPLDVQPALRSPLFDLITPIVVRAEQAVWDSLSGVTIDSLIMKARRAGADR